MNGDKTSRKPVAGAALLTSVRKYVRPANLAEVLAARRENKDAQYLAGGTFLLAGDKRSKPESLIDIGSALPRNLALLGDGSISLAALASFQEVADWSTTLSPPSAFPVALRAAILSMANRNTRNRATIGGNLGADKSCSTLIPILVALGTEVETASPDQPQPQLQELEAWLEARRNADKASTLAVRIVVSNQAGRGSSCKRWARTACDISILEAAASLSLRAGRILSLRLALGGFSLHARRFPAVEAAFEGSVLPSREKIESLVAPLLSPIDDVRGSADFKRYRGASLVADAILEAAREAHR